MKKKVNVEKGKQGFQPTVPRTITPEDAYRDIRRRDPIYRLQDWWHGRQDKKGVPGLLNDDGTPHWRPRWLPVNRPTVVPHIVTLSHDGNQRIYITPTGDLMVKQYDSWGSGAGSKRIGRFGYGRAIKKASHSSWKAFDEEKSASAESHNTSSIQVSTTTNPDENPPELYSNVFEAFRRTQNNSLKEPDME